MTEIIIRVLTYVIVGVIAEIVIASLWPFLIKKETEENKNASKKRIVELNSRLKMIFIVLTIFILVVSILLTTIPAISNYIELNYLATILVMWIPLIFNMTMLFLLMNRVNYNDNEFTFINAIGIRKTYKFENIVSFKRKNNLIIHIYVKSYKRIVLFNALSGLDAFVEAYNEWLYVDKNKAIEYSLNENIDEYIHVFVSSDNLKRMCVFKNQSGSFSYCLESLVIVDSNERQFYNCPSFWMPNENGVHFYESIDLLLKDTEYICKGWKKIK